LLLINQTDIVKLADTAKHVEDRDSDLFMVFPDVFDRRSFAAWVPDELSPTSLE
jgi:hypothetical protein